jgi:hypothetical protein
MTDHEGSYLPSIQEPAVSEQLATELDRHRGRWVAVEIDKIIAVAESVPEVVRLANERGAADPIVFRVPLHPERLTFFECTGSNIRHCNHRPMEAG